MFSDDMQGQLRGLGYPYAEEVAIGMQGAVFRLGHEKIGKFWFHAGEDNLRHLESLYASLDGLLPYRTPQIVDLQRSGPYWVTIETELPGVPLHTVAPSFGSSGWERTRDCVVEVLGVIAQIEAPAVLNQMTVLA